jgi:hypothetical protein
MFLFSLWSYRKLAAAADGAPALGVGGGVLNCLQMQAMLKEVGLPFFDNPGRCVCLRKCSVHGCVAYTTARRPNKI